MTTAEKRDRVLLLFGRAAFQAQLLEEQLLQLLLDQKWTSDSMPVSVINEEERKLRKLTLGKLRERFTKEFPAFTHFADYLDKLTKTRNYLAHDFFRECTFYADWGSTYATEQRELEEMASELRTCTEAVEKFRKSSDQWKSRTSR